MRRPARRRTSSDKKQNAENARHAEKLNLGDLSGLGVPIFSTTLIFYGNW
jgi:hypothetical protein